MTINKAKTKELVFCRPRPTKFDMPDPLDGIAQERAAQILGVIFTGKLSFEDHVDFVMTLCSQRVYLLKLLRSRGLPIQQLHNGLCGLDIVPYYLRTPCLGMAPHQTATRTPGCFSKIG